MMQRRLSELYHGPETAGGTRLGDMGKPTLISEAMDAGRAYLPTLGQIGQFIYDMTPPGMVDAYAQDRAAGAIGPALLAILPGGVAARKGVKAAVQAAKTGAAKHYKMYDLPEVDRPFSADYPTKEGLGNVGEKLNIDRWGDPINARIVAGRRMVERPDESVSEAELNSLTETITGSQPAGVARRKLGGDSGRFSKRPLTKGEIEGLPREEQEKLRYGERDAWFRNIRVAKDLGPEQAPMVLAHEIGHGVGDFAGTETTRLKPRGRGARPIPFREIGIEGLEPQFRDLFKRLNGGKSPEDLGYPANEVRGELTAEAVRAAMRSPGAMKAEYFEIYERIAKAVKASPRLNRELLFNSLAGAAAVPVLAGGGDAEAAESDSLGAILTRAMEGR